MEEILNFFSIEDEIKLVWNIRILLNFYDDFFVKVSELKIFGLYFNLNLSKNI